MKEVDWFLKEALDTVYDPHGMVSPQTRNYTFYRSSRRKCYLIRDVVRIYAADGKNGISELACFSPLTEYIIEFDEWLINKLLLNNGSIAPIFLTKITETSISAPRIVVTNGMFSSTAKRRIILPSLTAPPDVVNIYYERYLALSHQIWGVGMFTFEFCKQLALGCHVLATCQQYLM